MQLDRALDYEFMGQGFESSRARQFFLKFLLFLSSNIMILFFYSIGQSVEWKKRMKKNRMPLLILLWLCFWWAPVNAETTKLDNIAACAGVVIGNGAIDFFMGDEAAFDRAADVAYSAYLSEVFKAKAVQNDIQIADQILGSNLDKVIAAYNSETFDNEMYEEIVGCYRALSMQLLEAAQVIIDNQDSWNEVKSASIKTIKRLLSAG